MDYFAILQHLLRWRRGKKKKEKEKIVIGALFHAMNVDMHNPTM